MILINASVFVIFICNTNDAFKLSKGTYRLAPLLSSNVPVSTHNEFMSPMKSLVKNLGVVALPILLQTIAVKSANAGFNDPIAREQRPEATVLVYRFLFMSMHICVFMQKHGSFK
jgi:hypothetical protein